MTILTGREIPAGKPSDGVHWRFVEPLLDAAAVEVLAGYDRSPRDPLVLMWLARICGGHAQTLAFAAGALATSSDGFIDTVHNVLASLSIPMRLSSPTSLRSQMMMMTTIHELDDECRQLCTFLHAVPARAVAETVTLSIGAITALDGGSLEATARKVAKLVRAGMLTAVAGERYRVARALRSSSLLAPEASAKDAILRLIEYFLGETDLAVLPEADNLVAAIVYASDQGWASAVLALAKRLWRILRHTCRLHDMEEVQALAWFAVERERGPEQVEVAIRIAWTYTQLTWHAKALNWARTAVQHAKGLGDPRRECSALYSLAEALRAAGRADQAVDAIDKVLVIARGVGPLHLSGCKRRRAELLATVGRHAEALEDARDAVDVSNAGGYWSEHALALACLGRIANEAGEFAEAREAQVAVAALQRKHPAALQNSGTPGDDEFGDHQ